MPISTDLRASLAELFDATQNAEIISKKDELIAALDAVNAGDQAQLNSAWQAIIKLLNPAYYVARDNTKKFNSVRPHMLALETAVNAAHTALSGNLAENNGLAADLVQFIFKVSNYYSIASTLDAANFDTCSMWLQCAAETILSNGLEDSLQHSIWHNLIGGHKSRAYQMGRDIGRPNAAVKHFAEAVRIHKEVLHSSLDNPNDVELRHVQMCYASTMLQDAMWVTLDAADLTAESIAARERAVELLNELTDARLVLKDGSPDLYRRAGREQARGYAFTLAGNFTAAAQSMQCAADLMRAAIGATGATGQLSAILNDQAEALISLAYATRSPENLDRARALLDESIALSAGQFEQMYADNARGSLLRLANATAEQPHRGTRLAEVITASLAAQLLAAQRLAQAPVVAPAQVAAQAPAVPVPARAAPSPSP